MKASSKKHPSYLRTKAAILVQRERGYKRDSVNLGNLAEVVAWRRRSADLRLALVFPEDAARTRRAPIDENEKQMRRILADRSFRAEMVRRCNTPPKQIELVLEWSRWVDSVRLRLAGGGHLAAAKRIKATWQTGVALLPVNEAEIQVFGKSHGRGKDFAVYPCFGDTRRVTKPGYTEWNGRRPTKYHRAVDDLHLQAYAVVRSGGRKLEFRIDGTIGTVKAPEGFRFGTDANGHKLFRVSRPADDYHFSAAEIFQYRDRSDWSTAAALSLVAKLETGVKVRELERLQAAADERAAAETWVCLSDSLAAGNCRAGTGAFAERFGLEAGKHYPANELLELVRDPRIGAEETRRLRLVVKSAIRRHQAEADRGLAELSYHSGAMAPDACRVYAGGLR